MFHRGISSTRLLRRSSLRVVVTLGALAIVEAADGSGEPGWAPDRLLVQLREPAGAPTSNSKLSAEEWVGRLGLPPTVTLHELRDGSGNRGEGGALRITRPLIAQLNGTIGLGEALGVLRNHSEVVFAEPDYIGTGAGAPSDPHYGSQWHHARIESERAWDITTGSSNVTVAVLDTGLNASSAEFAGRLRAGYDYANGDASPADDHGHGTAVAGVLAANANNNSLVAGVDWHCQVLPYKVLDEDNLGFYSWWIEGIYAATDSGAKVINLAAGGDSDSAALTDAINHAISGGAIFITVSHNDGSSAIRFPGRLPQCITVGATERDDTKASFSNFGPALDLVAPGRDIYTAGRTGTLEFWFGTSVAAPQVAGVAALIAAREPGINQRAMEQLLTATAQDQVGGPLDTRGWDQYFGHGRLNARHALMSSGPRPAPPQPLNVSTRARVLTGDRVTIGGFIITGAHAKNTLVRAVGPSLGAAGVPGALQDPTLELLNAAGVPVASNDDWRNGQEHDAAASGIPPQDGREAAIVAILPPGAYTAVLRGKGDEQGVALVEAYDLQQTPNSKLANISTRSFVDVDESAMIGGFIVGAPSNYVVRAIGPSLRNAGVADALADPTVELRDSDGSLVAANDDWEADADAAHVQSIGLAPSDPKESAIGRHLGTGNYTALVRGTNGARGIGLVEIYNVP